MLTLSDLQHEQYAWARRNFSSQREAWEPLLGAGEELGELYHSHLKQHQGIRGTAAEHEAKAKDALGDVFIYLADYASLRGWNLQEVIEQTWARVKKRNWVADPIRGGEGAES